MIPLDNVDLVFWISSDLSVWCFACDAYLDAQVIPQLRNVHQTAYILKFGEAPPVPSGELPKVEDDQAEDKPGC